MCFTKIFFLLLIVAFISANAEGQNTNTNLLDSFSAKVITSIRANEKQRAYIATDKSVFMAGEYVWFNAFLLNAVSQKLSSRTRFLFVDVVNDNDSVIK
ncbi:MAG: hypothetical protein ABI861_13620, partial [Panacibacter sp.]